MASEHTLLLLRHAQAVDFAAGRGDRDRQLTDYGLEQAVAVGNAIRSRAVRPDLAVCSPATRTRQTWTALGLDTPCEFDEDVYNAGSDTLLDVVRLIAEQVGTAMIIGHGPGLPSLAAQLAGPGSDQRALDVINSRYPTATLTEFAVDAPWADLQIARLDWLRLGQ
ncbi:SixA phosphatase family protein [Microlunatus soli]|uniref:Phosphohistidine phosphatase n=1 Tax=Microlunatus soli TaxID=630515 RepID=A0A1H1SRA9_9ACTN|nr:histidine phosphatase family protein [Microlunatus soli]SDS49919.1 phosphohistidine phosphatase [Microlunatus soli]